jgi:tetrahydromethanopterin S-methyltransferase subunit B
LGKKSELKDLVEIWKTGPDVQPVTVEEQDAFFDEWLTSVGIDKNKEVIPDRVKVQQMSDKLQKWFLYILIGLLILVVILAIVKH